MNCPKCHSRTKVLDTRNNFEDGEVYRRRVCLDKKVCGYEFFSVEFEVDPNYNFMEHWRKAVRGVKKQ